MSIELVKKTLLEYIQTSTDMEETLQKICNLLEEQIPHYHWVGFYFADSDQRTLHLGPYKGLPTDHKVIPFGKGICGQVAESNQTFLVRDVNEQDNYISCNIDVKSEIVVPIFSQGKNIGQIDIDSNIRNAFDEKDQELLEWLTSEIGKMYS